MKTLSVTTASIIISAVSLISTAHAESQSFANPKVGAQRLDLCLNWGVGCGKPAADAWCVSKGFTTSTGHVVAHDIGDVRPTRLITTGAVADQQYCDGFSQVTCFKPGAPTPVNCRSISSRNSMACVLISASTGALAVASPRPKNTASRKAGPRHRITPWPTISVPLHQPV